MTDAGNSRIPDMFGYLSTWENLLQDPALNQLNSDEPLTPEATSAILLLAQTIGYCRLYAIAVPEDLDGSLPATAAVAAARILKTVLQEAMQDSEDYPERWECSRTQEEMELLSCDLLRSRMHVWAVFVAVDEAAIAAVRDRDPHADELERLLAELVGGIQRFDTALRRDEDLLTTVAETRLIENWRTMLAGDYQTSLPWWLDGTLERTAAIDRQTDFSQPYQSLSQLQRMRRLQSIPAVPVLVAQAAARPPHRGQMEWMHDSTDGSGTAVLMLPAHRDPDGTTECRLQFHGPIRETLIGKPVALGNGRAIVRGRELSSLPGTQAVEAVFLLEELEKIGGSFQLHVGRILWSEVPFEDLRP